MKNKQCQKLADKKFTAVVRAAEKLLLGGDKSGWRYDILTKQEYAALCELQVAANARAKTALLNPSKTMPFSFVYRGHRYGLEYSNLGRVFVCFLPGGNAFSSSAFFALWDIKNDKA